MTRVHIELQRVQTWLFAVPRLRPMVGANALLGQTLRAELPALARETGRSWVLAPNNEAYPGADPNDPLKDYDNPVADAKDGILSRDGGHFEARFTSGAEAFAAAASRLLHEKLPGLRYRISVDDVEYNRTQSHLSTELPVLAPCQWTGRGLASTIVTRGDQDDPDLEQHDVSLDVAARDKAGRMASGSTSMGNSLDLASLLAARTKLSKLERPQELQELVGNGYLALIHADGNGVGRSAGREKLDCKPPAAMILHLPASVTVPVQQAAGSWWDYCEWNWSAGVFGGGLVVSSTTATGAYGIRFLRDPV